jgi:hypothetical protein
MEPEFENFLNLWGQRFVRELRTRLNMAYFAAPGINKQGDGVGDAYSESIDGRVRNKQYSGNFIKSTIGSRLYESIEGKVTPEGFELLMLDYWEYVNYGRQRGKYVPISPLEEWARTKGFPNPRGAAFGISTNIKRYGIAPTYFYDNAILALEAQFEAEADEMMAGTINDFFDKLLEKNIPSK